jgi:hypothetical protein
VGKPIRANLGDEGSTAVILLRFLGWFTDLSGAVRR